LNDRQQKLQREAASEAAFLLQSVSSHLSVDITFEQLTANN
jgi:hypothetical protein